MAIRTATDSLKDSHPDGTIQSDKNSRTCSTVPPPISAVMEQFLQSNFKNQEAPLSLGTKALETQALMDLDGETPGTQFLQNIPSQLHQTGPQSAPCSLAPLIHGAYNSSLLQVDDNVAPLAVFDQTMLHGKDIPTSEPEISNEIIRLKQLLTTVEDSSAEASAFQNDLGRCYFQQKNCGKAMECFDHARKNDKLFIGSQHFIGSQLGLAACHSQMNNYDKAIEHSNAVPPYHIAFQTAQFILGCCYGRQGNYTKAILGFNNVPPTHWLYSTAQYNIGALYYDQTQKDYDNAIKHFGKITIHTNHNQYYSGFHDQYYSGLCYIALNNPAKAREHLSAIPQTSPYYAPAQEKLAKLNADAQG